MISIALMMVPVLLTKPPPIVGVRLPDRSPPNARSPAVSPKLKVLPVLEDPVPAAYVVLAFVPVSTKDQPSGRVLTSLVVPALAKLLKSCVWGVLMVVSGTCACTQEVTKIDKAKVQLKEWFLVMKRGLLVT